MTVAPATSRGSTGSAGAITQIFDSTLGANAATIDTGAGAIAGSFSHLRVVVHARSVTVAALDTVLLQLNADATSAHYATNRTSGSNGGVTNASDNGTLAGAYIGISTAANATAGFFGCCEALIPSYASALAKDIVSFSSVIDTFAAPTNWTQRAGGTVWNQTGAVTRLAIVCGSGANFLAGSRLTVYGLT